MTIHALRRGVLTLAVAAAAFTPMWVGGPTAVPDASNWGSDFLVHDTTGGAAGDATAIEYGLSAPDGASVEGHNFAGGLRPDGFVHGDPTAVEYARVAPDASMVEYGL